MIDLFMQKIKAFWQRPDFPFLATVGMALIVLCAVIFWSPFSDWVVGYLGGDEKQKVVKFIGLGIAGMVAITGAVAVSKRASAQVKNNELVEKGHVQERFKAAAEHLGSENEGARIASFYEFFYLALDNDDLQENIFDILCAHLRFITTSDKYKPKENFERDKEAIEGIDPTEEVLSLLDILFQKTNQEEKIFEKFRPNLRESFLMKINLYDVNLQDAKLRNTNLRGADLRKADLQNAKLRDAKLRGAKLQGVNLQGAGLQNSDLQGVNLQDADLRGAYLQRADLQGAQNLKTANLSKAKIKGAIFPEGYEPPADADTTSDD